MMKRDGFFRRRHSILTQNSRRASSMRSPIQSALLASVFVFGAVLTPCTSLAQAEEDRSVTESRLAELREEIRAEEARLSAAERTEKASVGKLNSIARQIQMREELVDRYENRLSDMSTERDSLFSSITYLETELERLRSDYRSRATNAYRYGRMHDIALILSASSINEMLVRVQYLNRFSNTRKDRLEDISATATLLKERRTALQRTLVRNELLLNEAQTEKQELSQLKRNRQVEIDRARNQRDNISQTLAEKRSSADQLSSRIRVFLADETSRRERTGTDASNDRYDTETESFRSYKGRLPWPATGSVREPFGEIINPERGTRTNNLHIVIDTEASAEVRVVAAGRVSAIDVMPEYGRFVLVEHGSYLTFYGNLSLFYVSAGDVLSPGQVLGRAGTDAEPKGRAIFFGLFEDGAAVDPESWLQK